MTRAKGRTSKIRAIGNSKGFSGRRKNCLKVRKDAVKKAGQYAYVGRKVKKRDFRSLWIQRINAAVRTHGLSYSVFMNLLQKYHESCNRSSEILNRKTLAELAVNHKSFFDGLVINILKKHS